MIEKCDDCDSYDFDENVQGWYCTKKNRIIERFNPVPNWCPLRKKCIDCINFALDDFCKLKNRYVEPDDTCEDWED